MGHLLETVNPEAAKALQHPATPIDLKAQVGWTVLYRGRRGEMRLGRVTFPAIVTHVHDDGTVNLAVIYDGSDFQTQDRVPPQVGEERGFSLVMSEQQSMAVEIAALRAEIAALRAEMFGEYEPIGQPAVEILNEFETRIAALEKLTAKKPVGRPKTTTK